MTVSIRCAMVSTVLPAKPSRMVDWIRASVITSTFAVASSSSTTLVGRSNARARQTSCRWPTLKLPPDSTTTASRPPGRPRTSTSRWTSLRTCQSASSANPQAGPLLPVLPTTAAADGSRFCRSEPSKRIGSCGMTVIAFRSTGSGSEHVGMPSIVMQPLEGKSRRKALIRDDFPAPVRPTMPTFWPASMLQLTPRRTGGSSGS